MPIPLNVLLSVILSGKLGAIPPIADVAVTASTDDGDATPPYSHAFFTFDYRLTDGQELTAGFKDRFSLYDPNDSIDHVPASVVQVSRQPTSCFVELAYGIEIPDFEWQYTPAVAFAGLLFDGNHVISTDLGTLMVGRP